MELILRFEKYCIANKSFELLLAALSRKLLIVG
jgi:hypothetical protein